MIGALVVWSDVTDRENLLSQLEAQRARLSTIIANAPGAIVVVDKHGRVVLTNPVADQIYVHFSPIEAYLSDPTHIQICYPDGTPYDPRDQPLTRSALDGETQINLEQLVIWPDGQRRSLLVNSAPILDRKGNLNGAVGIFQDITPLKQVQEKMRRNASQIEVHHHLIQEREQERLAIAQDIHDGPLQELIGIHYKLADVVTRVAGLETQNEPLLVLLHAAQEGLKQQIRDLRSLCSDLRPPTLAPYGLEKAIRSHLGSFRDRYPKLRVRMELMKDEQQLPETTRLALFRIYQEALNNVQRHAQANEVFIRFALEADAIQLEIVDDGVGFKIDRPWVEIAREGHLGLVGAQERAEAVNGALEVISSPGKGTAVRVTIPRT